MRSHVGTTVFACFAVLHQLRSDRRSLPRSVLQSLVTSLVLSRLDYGNATLAGISTYLLQRLQLVMNSAARLVFSSFALITPLLQQLHWLRAPERIDFKLALLVYNCLHGTAPSYLVRDLRRTTDLEAWRRLRSASLSSLIVRRTRLSTIGDRSVVSIGRSSCLEQSSATCLISTVIDCFLESAEDSPLQLFFPLTHLTITL